MLALEACRPLETLAVGQRGDVLQLRLRNESWQFLLPGERTRVQTGFSDSNFLRRLQPRNVAAEACVRAVRGRVPASQTQLVFDATAGFGRDAMLLAAAGLDVVLCERLPLLGLLLADALQRARAAAPELLARAAARCRLVRQGPCDSLVVMREWQGQAPDVIYLDPMYSASQADGKRGLKRSALVNKQMRALQCIDDLYAPRLAGTDPARLLDLARQLAAGKVVVKRPPAAPPLAGQTPASCIETKSVRFDVYPA